jgi:hypothetical protein
LVEQATTAAQIADLFRQHSQIKNIHDPISTKEMQHKMLPENFRYKTAIARRVTASHDAAGVTYVRTRIASPSLCTSWSCRKAFFRRALQQSDFWICDPIMALPRRVQCHCND